MGYGFRVEGYGLWVWGLGYSSRFSSKTVWSSGGFRSLGFLIGVLVIRGFYYLGSIFRGPPIFVNTHIDLGTG